jgi:hypothetical protein
VAYWTPERQDWQPAPGQLLIPGHPLARGLLGAWFFNDPGDVSPNRALPWDDLTRVADVTAGRRVATRIGRALDVDNTNANRSAGGTLDDEHPWQPKYWTGGVSFFAVASNIAQSFDRLFEWRNGNRFLSVNMQADNWRPNIDAAIDGAAGDARIVYSTGFPGWSADADNFFASGLRISTDASENEVWYNGEGLGTPDSTNRALGTVSNDIEGGSFVIGNRPAADRAWRGKIAALLFWGRALRDDEFIALDRDPGQMFQRARGRAWVPFLGGEAPPVTDALPDGLSRISRGLDVVSGDLIEEGG